MVTLESLDGEEWTNPINANGVLKYYGTLKLENFEAKRIKAKEREMLAKKKQQARREANIATSQRKLTQTRP